MAKNKFFILIVDDDEDDTILLANALQRVGSTYEIQIVRNGIEALHRLNDIKKEGLLPSLIIVDINMPKMDGKQTIIAFQLDKDLSGVPIVVLSTSSNSIDKLFFQRRNIEMISKPFEYLILNKVAAQLLSYCNP